MENTKTATKSGTHWSKWVFRTVYWLVFAFTMWVGGTKLISDDKRVEVILVATCVDKVFWGIAAGADVRKEDYENIDEDSEKESTETK